MQVGKSLNDDEWSGKTARLVTFLPGVVGMLAVSTG